MPGTVRRWNYPPPLCIGKTLFLSYLAGIYNTFLKTCLNWLLMKWGEVHCPDRASCALTAGPLGAFLTFPIS